MASIANKVYLFDRDKNLQWTSSIDNLEDVAISADGNKIIAVASNKVYSLLVDAPEEKFHFPVGYPDAEWYEHESPNGQGWMTYNPEPPCYGYHLGDDWNAKPPPDYDDYGDPVYAVASGMVVYAKTVPGDVWWGNVIMIRHDNINGTGVITSMYAHLRDINVSEGNVVGSGQVIGTIGKGYDDKLPSHLHFEIRYGDSETVGIGCIDSELVSGEQGPQGQIDPTWFINTY
ncbi:MAG: hypothetical protein A3H01_01245 [Candidatus Wildermuthbacteria bacterium RIFCSPLOWO2_12_FULL_40_9]|uniref:M23ase beta-sheet core domain-containing protein n=1 Tax=Candidatus Wildermuthbacteria bacterium RIFCSPLOWO2_12_FULL_40_9 TaxID=1802467 RepID=A0A1G2RU12_9BACT|nr:MAG: hypothetical protein A3H01_01245 [Candidatus Wildermuthbacteria bacterium RIFCSPLOWO2_12_FULL_40_9]